MCYFGFRRATELQSSRAAEQQSSRGKNYLPTIFLLLLTIIISPQITMGQINPNQIKQSYSFIENKGQWDSDVLFLAKSNSLRVWITKKSMVFEQFEVVNANENDRNSKQDKEIKAYAIALEFQKSKNAKVEKLREGKTKLNYFIGNDKSKHKTGVMQYEEVMLEGIYDGIDMRYYFDEGEVRYDYIVHPNADPTQIELEIKGAQENKLENGELVMKTSLKPVVKQGLYAYQKNADDSKQTVNSSFVLTGNKLKLNIGEYDKSKVLVIDPLTLVNQNIIGYQNTSSTIMDVKNNQQNEIYISGSTNSPSFPEQIGSYVANTDIIIGKLNEDIDVIQWMTYIGSTESENALSLCINSSYIYFIGATTSYDYPLLNPLFSHIVGVTSNVFTVLNLDGNLIHYSTYLGNYGIYQHGEIEVDENNVVYLAGSAHYEQNNPYYTYKGITEQTQSASHCGFILALEEINSLNYEIKFSSKYCGDGSTTIEGLDIDNNGNIYITGVTTSSTTTFYPTLNAYDGQNNSQNTTVFFSILKFDENLERLKIDYNSFFIDRFNGNLGNGARDILFRNGKIYICGLIDTDALPLENAFDSTPTNNSYKGFLSCFEHLPTHTNLIYSSYFGGDYSHLEKLTYDDNCGNVIYVGNTRSELLGFTGYLDNNFSTNTKMIVGTVDIHETTIQTLEELTYIGLWFNYPNSILYNSSAMKIYAVGRSAPISDPSSYMSIFSLSKNECEYIQPCPCTTNANDWLAVTTEKGANGCAPNQCAVTHRLHIPEQYQCYQYLRLSNDIEGETIWDDQLIEFQGFNITDFNICILEGMTYTITLKLYRSLNDPNPCIIQKTVYCNIASETVPCKKDCDSIDYVPREPLVIDICEGCKIIVNYWTRKACGYQDIQVTNIEVKKGLITCLSCSFTDEELFILSIREIIERNIMDFEPQSSNELCSDTYRVSQATCWASWTVFINGDGITTLPQIYFITKPCNNECCSRRLRVCRISATEVEIFDLGPGEIQSSCENVTLTITNQVLTCFNRCSSLENIANNVPPFPKNATEQEMNETTDNMITSNKNSVYLNQNNTSVNITYNNIGYGRISLQVFGVLGNLIQENSFSLAQGTNSYEFYFNSLPMGIYFYCILIDDTQIYTNKIVIVR